MNSRERIIKTINHQQPDRVPLDLGATGQTGISASTLYSLRPALGLEKKPIDICEVFQMLGNVDMDMIETLGVDVIGINNPKNLLGLDQVPRKPWVMPDGTPVNISSDFQWDVDEKGNTYAYPQGDRGVPPSLHMPKGGTFFDNIDRSPKYDENNLQPRKDFKDSFSIFDDPTAGIIEQKSIQLYEETELGIIGNCGGAGFGDAAIMPGPFEKNPTGIRKMDEWLMAHLLFPDYVKEVFEMQKEVALKNLEIYKQAVGNRIQIIWLSGTDFGTQNNEMYSTETFRNLYKPFYKEVNDWVHSNTSWKTFYHSCGSIANLLDDFVEMGVDIINPVQCSAKGMEASYLKEKYTGKLVFWGGGVDTQHTLPFGTPEEVRKEVLSRLEIFSQGGGYVFNTIHNIVAQTPIDNIIAMFNAYREFNQR